MESKLCDLMKVSGFVTAGLETEESADWEPATTCCFCHARTKFMLVSVLSRENNIFYTHVVARWQSVPAWMQNI